MQFSQIAAVMAFAVAASASPVAPRNNYVYATFYNDNACTQGAGEPVSISNPGCLNESGRQSIYFQAGFDNADVALIESAGQNCPCQTSCDIIPVDTYNSDPFCYPIDLTAYNSLRFLQGASGTTSCPANNC